MLQQIAKLLGLVRVTTDPSLITLENGALVTPAADTRGVTLVSLIASPVPSPGSISTTDLSTDLVGTPLFGGINTAAFNLYWSAADNSWTRIPPTSSGADTILMTGIPIPTTDLGLVGASGGYFYIADTTNQFVRWQGFSNADFPNGLGTLDVPVAANYLLGFSAPDGSWNAVSMLSDDSDNVAAVAINNRVVTVSRNTVFDSVGGNWDRMQGNNLGVWVQGPVATGAAVAGNPVVGGTHDQAGNVRPIHSTAITADALGNPDFPVNVGSYPLTYSGAGWDRLRNSSAANQSATTKPTALMTAPPGEWSITNTPASNTKATATKAAGGAGVRHILRSFFGGMDNDTAGPAFSVRSLQIRDGASGVGTILASQYVGGPTSSISNFGLSGLNIFGSANTAMTVEFDSAGGASTFQTINASGYSTV